MIVAAGLTPAWQQILSFDHLRLGEVNRARDAVWCASGKVVNVGLALHHLGAESRMLCAVGGESGRAIQNEFASLGARAVWIETSAPTRICTTLLDRRTGATTELVENSREITADERRRFEAAYAEAAASADVVVLTGSLPKNTPASFYRDLLRATSGRAVLDIRGAELVEALPERPFLVKPNREELAQTVGRPLAGNDDLLAAMHELNDRGAAWVVVTQGRSAVWATSQGRVWKWTPPAREVVNPIGCGDCVAAGIAWGLDQNLPPTEAIRLGIAAAAENVTQLLPARLQSESVRRTADEVVEV